MTAKIGWTAAAFATTIDIAQRRGARPLGRVRVERLIPFPFTSRLPLT